MKRKYIIFLTFLVSINSNSASFNCSKASTNIEKTICENTWLENLDEELSFYYKKLRESLPQEKSSALLSEQREWIHERNKSCETAGNKKSCLNDRYQKRLNSLKIQYEMPLLPSTDDVNEICGEIAALDSTGRGEYGEKVDIHDIDTGITSYDINNDGVQEIAESCHGGTMHVPCVEFKRPNGTPLHSKTINYEWKTYRTYGLKAFNRNGNWFRLHSYDASFVKPAYISYMTPGNNEYVVCEFENKEVEDFLPHKTVPEAEELCREVTVGRPGKVKKLMLTEKPIITRADLRNLGRNETELARQGYVDYNNDGVPNYIGELEYASGAGGGCDYNYFDELSDDRKSLIHNEERSLLLEMQKVNLKGRHPNCGSWWKGGYMNHFFNFGEKVYFEYKTRSDRAIFKIEDNRIHEVCSVTKRYVTNVKSNVTSNK